MSIQLRTTEGVKRITDPMLRKVDNRKESAYSENIQDLEEARSRLDEVIYEIADLKKRLTHAQEGYLLNEHSIPVLKELIGENNAFLEEYKEFWSILWKAETVAKETMRTIESLKPLVFEEPDRKSFQKDSPDFYAQLLCCERLCLTRISKIEAAFTKMVKLKGLVHKAINDETFENCFDWFHNAIEDKKKLSTQSASRKPSISPPASSPKPARAAPKRKVFATLNLSRVDSTYSARTSPPSIRVVTPPQRLSSSSGDSSPPQVKLNPARISLSRNAYRPSRLLTSSGESLPFSTKSSTSSSPRVLLQSQPGTFSWETISLSSVGSSRRIADSPRIRLAAASWEERYSRGSGSLAGSSPRQSFFKEPSDFQSGRTAIAPRLEKALRESDLLIKAVARDSGSRKNQELASSPRERSPRASNPLIRVSHGEDRNRGPSYSPRERSTREAHPLMGPSQRRAALQEKTVYKSDPLPSSPRAIPPRQTSDYTPAYRRNKDRAALLQETRSVLDVPDRKTKRNSLASYLPAYLRKKWEGESYEQDDSPPARSRSSSHY